MVLYLFAFDGNASFIDSYKKEGCVSSFKTCTSSIKTFKITWFGLTLFLFEMLLKLMFSEFNHINNRAYHIRKFDFN